MKVFVRSDAVLMEFKAAYFSFNYALQLQLSCDCCETVTAIESLSPFSATRLVCLQIEDVADGAVKPPPNKIPIFFFGTHET